MKTKFTLLALVLCLTFSFNNVEAQTALDHMKELTSSFGNLKKDTWKYLKSVTKGKGAKKVEKERMDLIARYKEEKTKAMKVKAYNSDNSLKDAVIQYLDMSHTVLKEDFDKILDMEDIAEQSYDLMEAYILAKEKAGEKMDEAFQIYKKAEESFAAANDITLVEAEEDKLSAKISKASDALKYYNKIYLIYFKPYKQEAYALDAMNRADVSGVEQNVNSLNIMSDEAMTKLDEAGNYKGDASIKLAAQKFVKFYKQEAEKDFPVIVEFYLKQENFKKAEAAMNSKSAKQRTQEDVDKYNAAANEYNDAVNQYNQTIQKMNEARSKLFDEWSKSVDKFFETHSS